MGLQLWDAATGVGSFTGSYDVLSLSFIVYLIDTWSRQYLSLDIVPNQPAKRN